MADVNHTDRAHSPLGASGAERWMNCAGSITLIAELQRQIDELGIPAEDDPDYRREGIAMHEAAEHCLKQGADTWEIVGVEFFNTKIDTVMAGHIQVYLDRCREDMATAALHYIEMPLARPDVHPDMFGTLDFAAIFGSPMREAPGPGNYIVPTLVKVRDLKGGEGIVVDPEENPQMKYYAFMLIDAHPNWDDETPVELEIVQPRAFHPDGPIRTWSTTVGEIREWVKSELLPAMAATELDNTLDAGPHCRFCPAKLVCPLLTSLFRAAATCNPADVANYSNESLARSWRYSKAVKFYIDALDRQMFDRLNRGQEFPEIAKLVPKRANRVWKPEAKDAALHMFGEKAVTPSELKSPAELEKLGAKAKEFVKEHAYTPDTGLTVAPWDDPKPAVKVQTSTEAFAGAVATLEAAE